MAVENVLSLFQFSDTSSGSSSSPSLVSLRPSSVPVDGVKKAICSNRFAPRYDNRFCLLLALPGSFFFFFFSLRLHLTLAFRSRFPSACTFYSPNAFFWLSLSFFLSCCPLLVPGSSCNEYIPIQTDRCMYSGCSPVWVVSFMWPIWADSCG